MLSIFVMLLVAIAVSAGIGYGILTIIKSGEVSFGMQKNQPRVEMMASAISAAAMRDDGRIFVPVRAGGTEIPSQTPPAAAIFTTTSYGQPITYCPIGWAYDEDDDGNEFEILPSSLGMDAQDVADIAGRNVIAFLISPLPNHDGSAIPCSEVTLVENLEPGETVLSLIDRSGDQGMRQYGGMVTPVFHFGVAAPGSDAALFTLPTHGTVAHLAVRGEDGEYPVTDPHQARRFPTLDRAARFVTSQGIVNAVIHLPPAEVDVRLDVLRNLAGAPGSGDGDVKGRTVTLKGDGTVLRAIDAGASGFERLAFSGDAFMENLSLTGHAQAEEGAAETFSLRIVAPASSRIGLDGVAVGGVETKGGRIEIAGASVLGTGGLVQDHPVVLVDGGTVTMGHEAEIDDLAAAVAVWVNGGTFDLEDLGPGGVQSPPAVRISESADALLVAGNGRVTGRHAEIRLSVARGNGSHAEETVWAPPSVVTNDSCSGSDCSAVCPAGTAVLTGTCSTSNAAPLSGFGMTVEPGDGGGPDREAFTCSWWNPAQEGFEWVSPAGMVATATCGYGTAD